MTEEASTNFIHSFNRLVQLVRDAESAITRAERDQDALGVKQYRRLKQEYAQQLVELIGRTPQSVDLQAVAH
jgi:hypothetical protein